MDVEETLKVRERESAARALPFWLARVLLS